MAQELLVKQHAMLAYRCAKFLPSPYQAEDSNRMTLAYFCLSTLSLIPGSCLSSSAKEGDNALDVLLKPAQRAGFVDWIYGQQLPSGGFRGSDSVGRYVDSISSPVPRLAVEDREPANLVHSYTAVLTLAILGDDLSRLDRDALSGFIASCQRDDGSLKQFPDSPEAGDPRSTYAAFALVSMLGMSTSPFDVSRALAFLLLCQSYEGGFATRPHLEAQGGTTYCAVACFALCDRLDDLPDKAAIIRYLVQRQVPPTARQTAPELDSDEDSDDGSEDVQRTTPQLNSTEERNQHLDATDETRAGFQGRTGKDPDACYSFWCSAALDILAPGAMVDAARQSNWLYQCQHPLYGGIAREPSADPDVYHTYLALAALSLGGEQALYPLDAGWNCSQQVAQQLKSLTRSSRSEVKHDVI